MVRNLRVTVMMLTIIGLGLATGCGKEEAAKTQVSPTPAALSGDWQTRLPPQFAGLTLKDGGNCSLDTVNGALAGAGPISVKSGGSVAMVGWEVADLQAGGLGTSLGVQLNAATPYFIAAEAFVRPGLGAALKNPALDGGGLKVDPTSLNVPAGDYRVLFLAQSDSQLLRCDTGRTLRVQ